MTHPTPLQRISFLAAIAVTTGCAEAPVRCEFPLWVSVMPAVEADAECRRLGAKRHDNGDFISDLTTLRGCATKDRIITNGEEWVGGHELKHHVERNCKK